MNDTRRRLPQRLTSGVDSNSSSSSPDEAKVTGMPCSVHNETQPGVLVELVLGGRVCIVTLVFSLFYSTLHLRDLVSGTTELNFVATEIKSKQLIKGKERGGCHAG